MSPDLEAVDPVALVCARFPELRFEAVTVVDDGWDSVVLELDGEWVVRVPRRPEVAKWIERELRLLPELAPTLPVAIPRFELVARNGVACVGYRKLAGAPARTGLDRGTGRDLGRFLVALHRFPVERAKALGVPHFDPVAWRKRLGRVCGDFQNQVSPLLTQDERRRSDAIFARVRHLDFVPALVHSDLGPAHVLCVDARVVGVIDWSDARIGDPAVDLAWALNGTPRDVADSVARSCRAGADLRERSLLYHRLGPWWEVVHGLETGADAVVASGLEGLRARLPARA